MKPCIKRRRHVWSDVVNVHSALYYCLVPVMYAYVVKLAQLPKMFLIFIKSHYRVVVCDRLALSFPCRKYQGLICIQLG